jgi:hypothetical protein
MDITIQFEPTVDEIRTTVLRNSRRGRITSWIYAFIVVVAGVLVLTATSSPALTFIGVMLLVVGVFFMFIALLSQVGLKTVTARRADALCAPTELRLTADRYGWQVRDTKGDESWATTRILVSPTAWTFAVPPSKINIVLPKRALNAADRAAFEEFIAGRDRKLVKAV